MAKYLTAILIVLVHASWMKLTYAEMLRDPTMPPARLGLVEADVMPVETPKPVLQSVALGTTHKSALINGETVLLGQQFEGLTLVKLTASEAFLQARNGQIEVLRMEFPIQKNAVGLQPRVDTKAHRQAVLHITSENK